ncbi:predicted protein [Histoplasma capsulatum var. duboisii H88]|uniref:Predicted protein n=1 Tax=Ajellomyces capsulatus (strain H88) TaxID=544711 RepID=F0UKA1_AJEC8|nr:predicted protein [Histoplasma capsulatum var. duboisii H88]
MIRSTNPDNIQNKYAPNQELLPPLQDNDKCLSTFNDDDDPAPRRTIIPTGRNAILQWLTGCGIGGVKGVDGWMKSSLSRASKTIIRVEACCCPATSSGNE